MTVRWTRTAITAAIPVAVVAVFAGIVSYTHVYALAMRTHQGATAAHLLPLTLDGLIVAGSVLLLAGSRLGWLGVVPGVCGTLYANVMSMLPYGHLSATVASWPAVAFSVAMFMLERWVKSLTVAPAPAAVPVPGPVPVAVPDAPAELNGHAHAAAELFATDLADGRVPGIRAIRTGLHVGQDKAQDLQAYLRDLAAR